MTGVLLGALLVRGRRLAMPTAGSSPLLWAGYLAWAAVLLSTALCLYLLLGPGS
ncbi:MAG TPA: hypothetical protein VFS21_13380 [Roseiflexaceae bacterium]|nr:hypothetical protein [Roseiflexaceae bacterium]